MLNEGDHNTFKEILKYVLLSEMHPNAVISIDALKCVLNNTITKHVSI
jgi:hypothetical protein